MRDCGCSGAAIWCVALDPMFDFCRCDCHDQPEQLKRIDTETNSTVDDRERRQDLRCSHCPPNKWENQKSYKRYGETKPKYKDKRR